MTSKMKCFECGNPQAFKGHRVAHKYKESGLDYVTLVGIEEFKCPQCGAVYYEIPKLKELHSLIAETLLKKNAVLLGEEIRFLRKQLGYSTTQFGALISYDPKTLSRIENGLQKVTRTFDRLVRMTYASGQRDLNYNLHDLLLSRDGVKFKRLELEQSKSGWEVKAA